MDFRGGARQSGDRRAFVAGIYQPRAGLLQHDSGISRSTAAAYCVPSSGGITKNAERSTRIAAQVGEAVALLFIFYGLYRFFVGANFGGLWMAFIGWFLLDAARSSYVQVGVMSGLRGHRVADVMERDCSTVEGYISLRDFIDQYLLHSSSRCFVVTQNHNAVGVITANEARKVDRENWDQTSVQSVMRPLNELPTVSPDTPALKALELMNAKQADELVVMQDGELQGIFSQAQVVRFLQMYSGMGHVAPRRAA